MASAMRELDKLRQELELCLRDIRDTALTRESPAWSAFAAMFGAPDDKPLDDSGTWANPAEFRAVLRGVVDQFNARLSALEQTISPNEEFSAAVWTFRHRRLGQLVNQEVAAYIQSRSPRLTVGKVFAHAPVRGNTAASQPSRSDLRCCGRCGAPRAADSARYGDCEDCNQSLLPRLGVS